MTLKPIRPENVSPVTALEFYDALIKLWRGSGGYPRRTPQPRKLGLAISGGGDSMALAYLCKQLVSERLIPDLSLQAFVVDHQARKESTEEANKVSRWLEDLDLRSEILKLQWPQGAIPSELSDFETQARRFRYQALGAACRDNSIPALLLGHHLDDNIETVIMRLSQGQQGPGLKGVPNVGLLPECHGLYGVSGSGGIMDLADTRSRSIRSDPEKKTESTTSIPRPITPVHNWQLPISDGGISILRPFNSFPKARLLATCSNGGVPFVNDPTNFDFALTPRNTVRYLLSSGRLPEAFQPASILRMIEKGKAADEHLTATSDLILKESRIFDFDRRSGKLFIQFPPSTKVPISDPKTRAHLDGESGVKEKAQGLAIRRVLDLISPGEDNSVRLEDCRHLPGRIFPKCNGTQTEQTSTVDKFTIGGVQFQRARSEGELSQSSTWLFTREPIRSTQERPVTTISVPHEPDGHDGSSTSATLWSDWHLWDSRYWIRIQPLQYNHDNGEPAPTDPVNINIRPLGESDLTYIRHQPTLTQLITHETSQRKRGNNTCGIDNYRYINPQKFNGLLSSCAPGKTRFTLPVLAEATGEERVLALPTLGIIIPTHESVNMSSSDSGQNKNDQHYLSRLKWEIMYKRVDPEVLEFTQAVV